jgi:cytochrome d ubiquinol oxidase subunit II
VFNLIMFMMHGAIYLLIKTEGELQKRAEKWAMRSYIGFVLLFLVLTGTTLYLRPEMIANFSFGKVALPGAKHDLVAQHQTLISVFAWIIVLLNVLSIANIPRMLTKKKYMGAFISSACTMGALIMLFALGIFPNMMISNLSPDFNLDIYNGASSGYTLETMFKVAIFGMPFVLAYTTLIYWTYRGKTKLTKDSY